jgi:hypothetical protein
MHVASACKKTDKLEGRVMNNMRPTRFWLEVVFGVANAALLTMTLVWPDWIERIFNLAPDSGDGSVEWGWSAGFAVATLIFFADAGRRWWGSARMSDESR